MVTPNQLKLGGGLSAVLESSGELAERPHTGLQQRHPPLLGAAWVGRDAPPSRKGVIPTAINSCLGVFSLFSYKERREEEPGATRKGERGIGSGLIRAPLLSLQWTLRPPEPALDNYSRGNYYRTV